MIDSILEKALALGASLAGIVGLDDATAERIRLPKSVPGPTAGAGAAGRGSVLVLALAHGVDRPELDWWGGPGGTEGNRQLQEMSAELKRILAEEHGIHSRVLPYDPWKGGILLKNAAALAGLGVIGANNLLITPRYGPRVRLRAMWADFEHPSTGSGCPEATGSGCPEATGSGCPEATGRAQPELVEGFAPCEGCPKPCWRACPQEAFASGAYDRARCAVQMEEDEARTPVHRDRASGVSYIEYCRACELACPVGR